VKRSSRQPISRQGRGRVAGEIRRSRVVQSGRKMFRFAIVNSSSVSGIVSVSVQYIAKRRAKQMPGGKILC
jgi:hypothetical protein